MKISWLILTYNRANSVTKAIPHCMHAAKRRWDEVIWVDNGSEKGERNAIEECFRELNVEPVKLFLPTNLGVAKVYNRCLVLATGTHVVITGCDMLMPEGWLDRMATCFEKVPNTGIVTIYAAPIDSTPERIRGPEETLQGIRTRPAMPIGRRMLSRDLLSKIGYFHEGFGMYGWDDVAWGHTAERVCKEQKLRFYNLPDMVAEHLGTEGNVGYDFKDEHEYWAWKKKQVNDPAKSKLLAKLAAEGYPSYRPFP